MVIKIVTDRAKSDQYQEENRTESIAMMQLSTQTFLAITLLLSICINVESGRISSSREKRFAAIQLPEGTSFTVVLDLIIPVVPLLNSTFTFLWFDFPVTFNAPTAADLYTLYTSFGQVVDSSNVTSSKKSLIDHEFVEEKRVNYDRRKVYEYIEGVFQSFGLDGPSCLKRAICELAESPLANHGLFGKAIQILASPILEEENSLDNQLLEELACHPDFHFMGQPVEDEYSRAYRKGRDAGGCSHYHSACRISILKLLDF